MTASQLLQWSSVLRGFSELSDVKQHLLGAGREVLLAIQGLLGVVEKQSVSGQKSETIETVIRYAKKAIQDFSQRLPGGEDDGYRILHRKVMNSILDVLEQEIQKNSHLKGQKALRKVEALQAIRQVLLKEIGEV